MSGCVIVADSSQKFTVDVEPIAEVKEHYEFVCNGITVGKVSAKFDFSDLPTEHHGIALNLILGDIRTVVTAATHTIRPMATVKKHWWDIF